MLTAVVALFGAGLASFLAPCVLPLVPAYLGMLAGEMGTAAPERAVPAAAAFVAGFGGVFVAVGSLAGAAGSSLTTWSDGLQRAGGVVIVVLGLALVGRGPRLLQRSTRLGLPVPGRRRGPLGFARPLVLGVVFGTAWTPCVGPLLGAALLAAAGTGSPWRGAVALAAYATGLGVPFVAAAAGLGWTPSVQRRLRRAAPVLARVGAVVLVGLGVTLVLGRYGAVVALLRW